MYNSRPIRLLSRYACERGGSALPAPAQVPQTAEAPDDPYLWLEEVEGGHGSGVTPARRARMYAPTYAYLLERLTE